ncbi:MAG: hypothetical protein APR63_02900 [Desulfuromonas sp. SDB]|nr:MAG: hypothetical protein APR63_02900 [Desulfuromonas sp. SDB]
MIDTKLILVEGPPGSGKTTTAQILAEEITAVGCKSRSLTEWQPDHPIPIGDDLNLKEVVKSSLTQKIEILDKWEDFSRSMYNNKVITVMESRFWQTGAMLMFAAGYPAEQVFQYNQQIVERINRLSPVLIYLVIENYQDFIDRMISLKEQEWSQAGNRGTWIQHVYDAFNSQKWLKDRNLTGLDGILAFMDEWKIICENLYTQFPFPKTKIYNSYQNWDLSLARIREFLKL